MTEPHLEVRRGFWAELFTAPRLITFVICIAGGGAWVQALRSDVVQLREQIARERDRVTAVEQRMDRETKINADIYMRRDNLSYELVAIREEMTRQRAQIEGLRKDLR